MVDRRGSDRSDLSNLRTSDCIEGSFSIPLPVFNSRRNSKSNGDCSPHQNGQMSAENARMIASSETDDTLAESAEFSV